MLLISTPHCKCDIKYSRRRSKHCQRTEKNEFDGKNAGTWVRILSFICLRQGTEARACNINMNETPAQVFSSKFCKVFKNTFYRTSPGDCLKRDVTFVAYL